MVSWQRSPALAVAAAMLLVGCSDGEPAPVETADPFAAVVAARATFEQPVVTLATEVQELQIAARRVRVEGLDGATLDAALADLDQRIIDTRAAALDVDADPTANLAADAEDDPAVVEANAAWDTAAASAMAAADAAQAEADTARVLADLDDRLDAVAATWNEPGSRRQQLERFAEAAQEADTVADEAAALAALEVDPACLTAAARRITAAETIAERTRELRDLIDRFAGTQFDEKRAEYSADPDGLGPLADLDAAQATCWDRSAAVVVHVDDTLAAIQALQEALNPPPR